MKINNRREKIMIKKVAVITGASSGIGAVGAVRLAKEGFDLVIAARRENRLEEVAEKCRAEGAEVLVIKADASKEEDVNTIFDKAIDKFGTIDFVWSNQGVLTVPTVFEELTVDQFYTVSENNFKSTFLMLTKATNVFKALKKPGNVVCTGSSSGIRAEAGFGVYSASKAAVIQLVKAAAIECGAKYNIRYNCVCPGGFVSEMTAMVGEELKKSIEAGKEFPLRRSQPALLTGRNLGDPEAELVGLIAFLASDESSFITGAALSVDCGITQ